MTFVDSKILQLNYNEKKSKSLKKNTCEEPYHKFKIILKILKSVEAGYELVCKHLHKLRKSLIFH